MIFCVRVENCLVLLSGWIVITWFLCRGIEIDLLSVCRPRMIQGSTDLFYVWVVKIDLVSLWGIEIGLISVYGSELTWFGVGIENDLV